MLTPSIALATGPYDWREADAPCAMFEARLSRLRALMRKHDLSHVIVYGNTFDHEALARFSHFTPKLGPALMLVADEGAPRLLFSGGPGMKPSAARLTWIEDVAALRGLDKEVGAWLEKASAPRVGLIAGASILHGDFETLRRGAGGVLVEIDDPDFHVSNDLEALRDSARLLQRIADHLFASAAEGVALRDLALDAERLAYAQGAQDVRLRIARRAWGPPTTLPDADMPLALPAPIALAVRRGGVWAYADFVLGDIGALASAARAALETTGELRAYANRVAFPEPPAASEGLLQAHAQVEGAHFSAPCFIGPGTRELLFRLPGL
jgi:hypothetical protein